MSESAIWYYARGGQQLGPITLANLQAEAETGRLHQDDLVWCEGLPDWIEAKKVKDLRAAFEVLGDRGAYDVKDQPTPVAPGPAYAPGTALPYRYPQPPYAQPGVAAGPYAQPTVYVPGYASPAGAGVLGYGTYNYAHAQPAYAGFWIRFVAAIVDGIITAIPGWIIGAMIAVADPSEDVQIALALFNNVLGIVIQWLYEALFTASSYQATPGKMILGLRVCDVNGNPISFGRATGRHFAKILSGLICLIGYIMAAWDERKRSLHDQIAGTLVVYK